MKKDDGGRLQVAYVLGKHAALAYMLGRSSQKHARCSLSQKAQDAGQKSGSILLFLRGERTSSMSEGVGVSLFWRLLTLTVRAKKTSGNSKRRAAAAAAAAVSNHFGAEQFAEPRLWLSSNPVARFCQTSSHGSHSFG